MVLHNADDRAGRPDAKPLSWWLVSIAAPIGIIGGPLTLAHLLAGMIEWHGPIQFAITYWHEQITAPFHIILKWLNGLFGLPPPPDLLTDYIVLAILLAASIARAEVLIVRHADHRPGDPINLELEDERGDDPAHQAIFLHRALILGSIWPVGVVSIAVSMSTNAWLILTKSRWAERAKRAAARQFLALAPFVVFLAMWAVNHLLASG